MSEPTKNRAEGSLEAVAALEKSPEILALNFFELSPLAPKVLFTITPLQWDWKVSKISYNFGCMDLSANGYMQVILSKVANPNVYGVLEQSSNILFSKMGGANQFVEGDSLYLDDCVMVHNEPHYLYLITNIPAAAQLGVLGRISIYYRPMFR